MLWLVVYVGETGSVGHCGRVPGMPQPRVRAAGPQFVYRVCTKRVKEQGEAKEV